MLDKNIKYFQENKKKFKELYPGKYIVIKNKKVIGTYDTHTSAYEATIKTDEVGSFIIEHIK